MLHNDVERCIRAFPEECKEDFGLAKKIWLTYYRQYFKSWIRSDGTAEYVISIKDLPEIPAYSEIVAARKGE